MPWPTPSTAGGGDTFTIGGTYEDRLVRIGDEWRIAGRTLIRTWTEGSAAVLSEARGA
jgi:hypothetical protein